jgi:uncharacterized protein (DUF1778 family)
MTQRRNRTARLDLRLTSSAKETLRAAATAQRRSVSGFVLEAAPCEAEERLADRHVFLLDAKSWDFFVAALDAHRAVLRAWNDCFARLPDSILEANPDAFA